MLDFAGGTGILSGLMKDLFGVTLPIYDPYMQEANNLNYLNKSDLKSYSLVFNSAMFEHVLSRLDLDEVNNLVSSDGSLGIHTVVCETIPKDPNWFYLVVPVHTAFHTNRSMSILMEQWGYKSSIYAPRAKSWLLLKDVNPEISTRVDSLNEKLRCDWFYFKKGFLDYWKQHDSPFRVIGHRMDVAYYSSEQNNDLPVFAFEAFEAHFAPDEVSMLFAPDRPRLGRSFR